MCISKAFSRQCSSGGKKSQQHALRSHFSSLLSWTPARVCPPGKGASEIRFVDFYDDRNADDSCESDDADRDQLELEMPGLQSGALEDIALEVSWINGGSSGWL